MRNNVGYLYIINQSSRTTRAVPNLEEDPQQRNTRVV